MKQILSLPRWWIIVAGLVLTGLLAVWVLVFHRKCGPLEAMPPQTVLAMAFPGAAAFDREFGVTAPSRANFSLIQSCRKDLELTGEIFPENSGFLTALRHNACAAGWSLYGADSLHAIFALDVSGLPDGETVLQADASAGIRTEKSQFRKHVFYTHVRSPSERLVMTRSHNLILFSRYSYLVEDALLQLEQNQTWWPDVASTRQAGDADLRILVSAEALAARWEGQMSAAWKGLPGWLAARWKWFEFNKTSTGWQFAAYPAGEVAMVSPSDAASQNFWAILPDNTAFTTGLTLSTSTKSLNENANQSALQDFQQYVSPWVGKEAAYVLLEPFSSGMQEDQCLIFPVKNDRQADLALQEYGKQKGLLKRYEYQTYTIDQFLSPALLEPFLPLVADRFVNPAVVRIGGYAVFAASAAVLELWIDKYIVSQTLANQTGFLLLQQSATDQLPIYINSHYLMQISREIFSGAMARQLAPDLHLAQQAGLWGASLKTGPSALLSGSIHFRQLAQPEPGVRIVWKAPLAGDALTRPFVLNALEQDAEPVVLIQDSRLLLHCFNLNGNPLWQKQLDKPLQSDIHGIDYYGNGRRCFLFNTATAIWLLDEEGKEIAGYPLQLQSPATNGLTVVDFDDSRHYVYFIVCFNGNLYGMDQYGRPIPGWNPQAGVDRTNHPLLHFKYGSKDYLAILSLGGRLSVFNRDGSNHFLPQELEGSFPLSPLQVDLHADPPRMVCMNSAGQVFSCDLSGKITENKLGGLEPDSENRLVLSDLTRDDYVAYGLQSGSALSVFDGRSSGFRLIRRYRLNAPQDALFSPGLGLLGVLNQKKQQVTLLSATDGVLSGFPLAGTTEFSLFPYPGEVRGYMLLVGNRQEVYAYRVTLPAGR